MKRKIIYLLVAWSVLSCFSASAQLLDSLALEQMVPVTDLQEAVKDPEAVVKLELRKNRLKKFPEEILLMKKLQYLDLSKNSISEIPAAIGELKNLQILILSKNNLETLPAEIGGLSELIYLNVNQNELSALPAQMGKLTKLRNLDLWSNNIETFPEELKYMKSLQILDLRVILIPDDEQRRIQDAFPATRIYFSPYCKCAQ